MKQYLDLCSRIVKEGEWVENERTGTRCLTVINADLQYNVKDNEFPLVTTRKSFWKSAVAEMLGYIRGYSSAADFRAAGTPTWNANANENEAWLNNPVRKGEDDMGVAYRFRTMGYYQPTVTLNKPLPDPKDQKIPRVNAVIAPDFSMNKHGLVGQVIESNNFGEFTVIKEYFIDGTQSRIFDVQFTNSGFVKKGIKKPEVVRGEVKDLYYPAVQDIGCIGDISEFDTKLIKILKPVWNNLIKRCYGGDENHDRWYSNVFVCDEWLVFENFVRDFKKTENWELKMVFPDDYSIDKDWVNANYYSKETVRWSTKKEQSINAKNTVAFTATNIKTQKLEYWKGAKNFVEEKGLSKHFCNTVGEYLEGDTFEYNGWNIEIIDYKKIRYIEVDQFKQIIAKLTLGIDDRRLIMDAWYPHSKETACLMPCMYMHQFSLLGDNLYLNSTQRSVDVPLGLVFNQVQVFFLLAIVAQITGKKAHTAYHKLVNAHIYEDQLELMETVQLKREPFASPKFWINPNIKTLEDLETWVTVDDFSITDYEHHEGIKYPFSV